MLHVKCTRKYMYMYHVKPVSKVTFTFSVKFM